MDASAIVCLCNKFSDTKVLASTEESACDGMDISSSSSDTWSDELGTNIETGVWPSRSSHHVKLVVVADSDFTALIHFYHKIRWCLEWILNAGIC